MHPHIRRSLLVIAILTTVVLLSVTEDPARADTFGSGTNTFDIEFVTIGDPGNPADRSGRLFRPPGSVDYVYKIGKYEISRDMVEKTNNEGGLGITLADMTDFSGVNGPDQAATGINWFEAATFVNWLNSSSGYPMAYNFAGGDFQLWQPGDAGYDPKNRFRNSLAHFFLPSEDEWYKAAYYDPNLGIYYKFPTGSDVVPDGIDFAGDAAFDAVFFDGFSNRQPNDITDVGVLSPYGTAGQGGNVAEWQETEFDLVNSWSSSSRGFRGGNWGNSSAADLSSLIRLGTGPSGNAMFMGFRVASIPEPSSLILGALAAVGLLHGRQRWT